MCAKARVISVGSRLSLHASAEHNNIGLYLLQCLIAQPQPFHYPSGEVFHDNISPGNELLGYLHSLRMGQVKGYVKLAAIVVIEKMTTAFHAVHQAAQEHKAHNRLAAYLISVSRVAEAMKLRGWV